MFGRAFWRMTDRFGGVAASRYAIGGANSWQDGGAFAGRRAAAQDRDVALPRVTIGIQRVDQAVAAHYGVKAEDARTCLACGGAAKFVAVELSCRLTGITQREIGAHYGDITSAGVSNIRRRLRNGQYPFRNVVEQLLQQFGRVSG